MILYFKLPPKVAVMIESAWNYVVRTESPTGGNILQYFTKLDDAFKKTMSISVYSLCSHLRAGICDKSCVPIAEIKSIQRGETEIGIEVTSDADVKEPGLYYHFPRGIRHFEEQTGISFRDFKGYKESAEELLVSHLILELSVTFKDGMAYARLKEHVMKSELEQKQSYLTLTGHYFGDGNARSRKIHPIQYRKEFYFSKGVEALEALLHVDFHKLNETVAWENDLPDFLSKAAVEVNGITSAELHSVLSGGRQIGLHTVKTPGIHVAIYGNDLIKSLADYAIDWGPYPGAFPKISQVGQYNEAQNRIQPFGKLATLIHDGVCQQTHSKTPETKSKVVKKSPVPKKGRRRGIH